MEKSVFISLTWVSGQGLCLDALLVEHKGLKEKKDRKRKWR
jgi:hypothetical protein